MKPILFNTEMVRAILDGRKSMTRRVIKPQPPQTKDEFSVLFTGFEVGAARFESDIDMWHIRPRYQPGDVLWVRETWRICDPHGDYNNGTRTARFTYRAGGGITINLADDSMLSQKWRPSIHMPREAARIFLRVTNVRAERLQEITVDDVMSEGLEADNEIRNPDPDTHESIKNWNLTWAQHIFAELWDNIYASPRPVKRGGAIVGYVSFPWREGFDLREYNGLPWRVYGNPWVWVYSFERISKEEAEK